LHFIPGLPFHTWGVDSLGLFSLTACQLKYIIAAMDYFTKWIEAEPVLTIQKIQHFVWKNVVFRFGIPKRLVSDNGTQFASQQLGELCKKLEF